MPGGSWLAGWGAGNFIPQAEMAKGMGSFFDSTLGAPAASFDITSVPTWGSHLLIEFQASSDQASVQALNLRFNNDSAGNYDRQQLVGSAAVASADEVFAATSMFVANLGTTTAGTTAGGALFIPNFRNTTFNKMVVSLNGLKSGTGSGAMAMRAVGGFWRSSSAITRITLIPAAGNVAAGSRCTAYVLGP